jgi:hypothetical protein
MTHQPERMIHESRLPFRDEPIACAAVYCSDGRLGDHVDDLLARRLEAGQFDRLAVPGGPAVLVEHPPCFFEMQSLTRQLQFLVEAHRLRKVLLIAHQGCQFYLERLRVPPEELEAHQRIDLQEAARRVRRMSEGLSVHAILAHVDGQRVRFEVLEC